MVSDADVVEPVFCMYSMRPFQLRVVPGGWVGEKVPLIGDAECHRKRRRITAAFFILESGGSLPFLFCC